MGYLGGRTLGELLNAERRGTEIALAAAGRPSFTYLLPRDRRPRGRPAHLPLRVPDGAVSGELYGIDAFDQPGVEAGKIAAYALMGRAGYEKDAGCARACAAVARSSEARLGAKAGRAGP